MGSIVLKTLSVLLGLFFILVGILKITCFLSKELHKDMRKEYVKYAKVFPFNELIGYKIPAKWYRKIIGTMEIICGFALMVIPKANIKKAANVTLIAMMALNIYSHYMVEDRFERIAPALVFFFMLIGRLVIEWQINRQQQLLNGGLKVPKQE
ncbi:novel acetylcholine receptor chaperone-like [Planococcus citri]|uniref:novel acetylcholine receptor chaperone-like n=1 Tax=Planococcus citri TaxID=170843 RepID=UPI0031F82AB7